MTTDRDFDRIAMAWLADGPEELSDRVLDAVVDQIHLTRQRRAPRVPWRFPTMTMPARVVALVAIGALVLAGALAAAGIGGRAGPIPTTRPSIRSATLPTLDATFTSPRNGFKVTYPSGWTVTPAAEAWAPRTQTLWGDPALDEIRGSDVRFVGTQQTYADGQTSDDWLRGYCALDASADCSNVPASWPSTTVAGYPAYLDLAGVDVAAHGLASRVVGERAVGTIAPGWKLYDVIVPISKRAYVFTIDGNVDRSTLDAFLSTIELKPGEVVDTPPLTGRFTSPTYGYSIGTLPGWTITPSTKTWNDTSNGDFMDGIDLTSVTGMGVMSQPLGGRTFDEFVNEFYVGQHQAVGSGCDGGEPSTWPQIAIGDQTGRLEVQCGSAEALVAVDGRVYLFELGLAGQGSDDAFSVAAWKQLLTSVIFDPAAATN